MIDPRLRPLLSDAPAQAVLAALARAGGEGRIVGGAVRNLLMGRSYTDVDIATDLAPEQTIGALEAAGFKAVPTGLQHGTITGVAFDRSFEITTLRHDVETDGRHAVVAFTDDWRADAQRRDFTFNALYLDARGKLYDYFNGQADIAAGQVRFIGRAEERLREDYLRLLRFFRFYAHYGRALPDTEVLTTLHNARDGLKTISMERIRTELIKLLSAADPVPSIELMIRGAILDMVLPDLCDALQLKELVGLETARGETVSALRRLAALSRTEAPVKRLKLSNAQADRVRLLIRGREADSLQNLFETLDELLYRRDPEEVRDRLLLAAARRQGEQALLTTALGRLSAWTPKPLPISGSDLIAAGMRPGRAIGQALRRAERIWIDSGFATSSEELMRCALQSSGSQ